MAISKIVYPAAMTVCWDQNGNVTGVNVTYQAVFTDPSTGQPYSPTSRVFPFTPGAGFLSAMASIWAAFPSSGL